MGPEGFERSSLKSPKTRISEDSDAKSDAYGAPNPTHDLERLIRQANETKIPNSQLVRLMNRSLYGIEDRDN